MSGALISLDFTLVGGKSRQGIASSYEQQPIRKTCSGNSTRTASNENKG
jgi:hypothetical protein